MSSLFNFGSNLSDLSFPIELNTNSKHFLQAIKPWPKAICSSRFLSFSFNSDIYTILLESPSYKSVKFAKMLPIAINKEKGAGWFARGPIHVTFRAQRLASVHEAKDVSQFLLPLLELTHKVGSEIKFLTLTLSTHRANALHVQVNGNGTDTYPRPDIDILVKLAEHYKESRASILHGLQQYKQVAKERKMNKAHRATTEAITLIQKWAGTTNHRPSQTENTSTEDLSNSILKRSEEHGKRAKELREKMRKLSERVDGLVSPRPPTSSEEIYTHLERKVENLLQKIGPQHPQYNEALIYQQRLEDNLRRTRRFGNIREYEAKRLEIIDQLNRLALSTVGISFNRL